MDDTRWIIVDDDSPDISYQSSSWTSDAGPTRHFHSSTSTENGPPNRGTLHGTNQSASFTFQFSGRKAEVYGTILADKAGLDPQWNCFIDNIKIANAGGKVNVLQNNQRLCGTKGGFADGPHTLVVNVSIGSDAQTFWLDYLRYIPSDGVSLEGQTISIDNNDTEVKRGLSEGQWEMLVDRGYHYARAKESGASFQFKFQGMSLAWYGVVESTRQLSLEAHRKNIVLGTYTIDNGSPHVITINHQPGIISRFHQKFFETETLPLDYHNISVVNTGPALFTLEYLHVQNEDPSVEASRYASSSKTIPTYFVPLLCGLGLLFLVTALVSWLMILRRRRTRQKSQAQSMRVQSFEDEHDVVTPIPSIGAVHRTNRNLRLGMRDEPTMPLHVDSRPTYYPGRIFSWFAVAEPPPPYSLSY